MKAKILYSLLFAIAMTIIATADYKDYETAADTAVTTAMRSPAHDSATAFLSTKYISDTTSLLIR